MKNIKEYILYLLDKLFKKPNLDNGLIEIEPEAEDWEHNVELGSGIPKKILCKNRNWFKYRSRGEEQKRPNSSETMACTIYSSHNAVEQIMNRMKEMVEIEKTEDKEIQELVKIFRYFELYDENNEANLSDPFTAKMAGTTLRGNNFNNICQSFRHNGVVAEKYHLTPEKYTWNEYYRPISQFAINKGKEFTEYVEINHEWVNLSELNQIKEYSPVATSVYAGGDWNTPNKIHQTTNNQRNHAIDNDYYEDKKYDGIFDSYIPFTKKVAWNYNFGWGKIFTFTLKKKLPNLLEIYQKEGTEYVMRTEVEAGGRGQIYDIRNNKLEHINPQEWNNRAVKEKSIERKLKPITEKIYNQLKQFDV